MPTYMPILVILLALIIGTLCQDFDERRDDLVKQMTVWDPKVADISSHPVSFLMARLKNELGRADKTLTAVTILCT